MAVTSSILDSMKPLLGVQTTDTSFDLNIILHINSVLMILNQLGVGPSDGFVITGSTEEWDDFIATTDEVYLSLIKSFVALKVQMMFDPPTSGIVTGATERLLTEFESRIVTQVETKEVIP